MGRRGVCPDQRGNQLRRTPGDPSPLENGVNTQPRTPAKHWSGAPSTLVSSDTIPKGERGKRRRATGE